MFDADITDNNAPQSVPTPKPMRQRSAIAFSYISLADIMKMVEAIHDHVGCGDCDEHQLSAWIDKSHKSSTFRIMLSTGRMFGLLSLEGDRVKLTPLGRQALDPEQVREAVATAFLSVPLYNAIFEKYKGGVLPPAAALEREMAQIGVAEKQVRHARLVMERSAEYAHFHEHGKDRLVRPGAVSTKEISAKKPTGGGPGDGDGGDGGGRPRHPLIEGLFQSLPSDGETWTVEDAAEWLQAAAYNLRFAYKFKGRIKVEIEAPITMQEAKNKLHGLGWSDEQIHENIEKSD